MQPHTAATIDYGFFDESDLIHPIWLESEAHEEEIDNQ